MQRAALMLLIAGVYVGCSGSHRGPDPLFVPPHGGLLRISVSASERDAMAWHQTRDGVPAFQVGSGEVWERASAVTPLDGVRFVAAHGVEPLDLLLLDEVDLTVVYGRQVRRLHAADAQRFQALRAPGWDRTYLLACNPTLRWTRDPNFRRWLAARVDREAMLERLFDSNGAPAFGVLGATSAPHWGAPLREPFGRSTRPSLRLAFDAQDRLAAAIGARLKASLELLGIELVLAQRSALDVSELILVGYQRSDPDPVTALQALIESAAPPHLGAQRYLEHARQREGVDRENLVLLAEDALLIDAQWIPLIRLDAWLGSGVAVQGVSPGLTGDLALGVAWRRP